jgi:hypothetical protein
MGPHDRPDGKYPGAKINHSRASLYNMKDTMHSVGIYSGTQKFPKHKSRNISLILHEQ